MKWIRFTHLSSGNSVIVHILSVFLPSVESIKLILYVVSFRKTVQLQWARFKKGPFLPEADISGKRGRECS